MKKDQIGYDLNEKDIDTVIRFLELVDPENATPDRAMNFLASYKKNLRKSADEHATLNLDEAYEKYKQDQKTSCGDN